MTLTEKFINDAIHIDAGAEVMYGSDEIFDTYPCRFPTIELQLMATDALVEISDRILGEKLDNNGVLVESNDAELAQFALLFEFCGDKNHIRHVLYCCSASRPATESATTEEETEVKTETLSLKATALPDGLVKSKTCENTDETTYNNWYKSVYIPVVAATAKSASSAKSAS